MMHPRAGEHAGTRERCCCRDATVAVRTFVGEVLAERPDGRHTPGVGVFSSGFAGKEGG